MTRPATTNYDTPLGDDDTDLFTIDEFLQYVSDGSFIDDDGFGYAVRDGMKHVPTDDFTPVYPSTPERIPLDATHIVWYND